MNIKDVLKDLIKEVISEEFCMPIIKEKEPVRIDPKWCNEDGDDEFLVDYGNDHRIHINYRFNQIKIRDGDKYLYYCLSTKKKKKNVNW